MQKLAHVLAFFLLPLAVMSQQKIVSGKITDHNNGGPLVGATIFEKGTKNTTSTKDDGSFSLPVRSTNPILVVSYAGFETRKIPVNNQTTVSVALTASSLALSEVVVVF